MSAKSRQHPMFATVREQVGEMGVNWPNTTAEFIITALVEQFPILAWVNDGEWHYIGAGTAVMLDGTTVWVDSMDSPYGVEPWHGKAAADA